MIFALKKIDPFNSRRFQHHLYLIFVCLSINRAANLDIHTLQIKITALFIINLNQYQLQQSTNIKNEAHLTNMSPDMREEVPVRAT